MWIFVLILLERQSRQFLNYFANLLHFHDKLNNSIHISIIVSTNKSKSTNQCNVMFENETNI